jgi:GNAT superfamily N-acetyltransferase
VPDPFRFDLTDHRQGRPAELTFDPAVSLATLAQAEARWRPEQRRLTAEAIARGVREEDLPLEHDHWNWRRKRERAPEGALFFGVVDGSEPQALMMLVTGTGRIPEQAGLSLVHVEYLEVAPWNLHPLAPQRRFVGLGSFLIEQAIEQSRAMGHHGRIGLHALQQAAPFYRRCGMTEWGTERLGWGSYEYTYFEMTPEQASRFVEGR